ncbi:MAG: hypothetical protein HQL18_04980 [Candidatus Omnitrophica bacterium]|nr:hypothetical protein [Candidatus Omnitrophota bacterium]
MRRPALRSISAFTLVEVLLVTTLTAGMSVAIFSCLSNGLRLWDRSRLLMVEEDVAFLMDRFSGDVRNSFPFTALAFSGGEHEVSFPTIVMGRTDRAGSRAAEVYGDGLGRVRYSFDAGSGILTRRSANYSQAVNDSWGEPQVMVKGLTGVRLRYLVAGSSDYRSIQDPGDPFPAGIEIEIRFMSGSSEKIMKRFVPIPAGLQ